MDEKTLIHGGSIMHRFSTTPFNSDFSEENINPSAENNIPIEDSINLTQVDAVPSDSLSFHNNDSDMPIDDDALGLFPMHAPPQPMPLCRSEVVLTPVEMEASSPPVEVHFSQNISSSFGAHLFTLQPLSPGGSTPDLS